MNVHRREVSFAIALNGSASLSPVYQPNTLNVDTMLSQYRYTGEIHYLILRSTLTTPLALTFYLEVDGGLPLDIVKLFIDSGESNTNVLDVLPRGRREPPLKLSSDVSLNVLSSRELGADESITIFGGAQEQGVLYDSPSPTTPDTQPGIFPGSMPVLDVGDAFRYRLVDNNYSWNNVNSFAPSTGGSIGSITFGPFPLKNAFGIRVYGGFGGNGRGTTTFLKLIEDSTAIELINRPVSDFVNTDLFNGFPGRLVILDTAAHSGKLARFVFEATAGWGSGSGNFVGVANEVIIY